MTRIISLIQCPLFLALDLQTRKVIYPCIVPYMDIGVPPWLSVSLDIELQRNYHMLW